MTALEYQNQFICFNQLKKKIFIKVARERKRILFHYKSKYYLNKTLWKGSYSEQRG